MKTKISLIKEIITDKKWILLFSSYFFFFLLFTSYDLGVAIYLTQINQELFWAFLLLIDQITIIIMPLIVTRISSLIGNLKFAKWSLFVLFLIFLSTFFVKEMIFIIFILFPFFLRIYNNSLNPFISTEANYKSLSLTFAVRDLFLFTGIATGLIISSIIFANSFSIVNLIRIFSIFLLIAVLFLFLIKKEENTKLNEEKESPFKFPIKSIKHKQTLLIFIGISCGTSWITFVIRYLPFYFVDLGFIPSEIFFSYAMTYFIVPLLAILATLFVSDKNSKNWYLFDLGIDIVPFSLILFADLHISIIILGLLFIQIRDFLAPIGLSYFFKNFEKSERNEAWGVLGTLASLFSLPFPLIIGIIFNLNSLFLFTLTIIIIIFNVIIAFFLLPKVSNEDEN